MENTQNSFSKIKGSVFIIIATFLWGSSFVVTKNVTETVPTFLLVALRSIIGGLFVAALCTKDHYKTTKKLVIISGILGVIYASGMVLQTQGIKYTSAGRSAFLTAAYCILMPFFEWKLMGNKPTVKNIVTGIICVIGIGFVALSDSFTIEFGDILSLAGSVCFGVYIALTGYFVKKYDAKLINMYQLLISGVILLIISLLTEEIPASIDTKTVLSIAYLSIFCSGIPTLLQTLAMKSITPTLATILLGFEPIFAAILSALIASEQFTARCLIGFALILLAVFLGEIDIGKLKHKPEEISQE